MNKDNWRPSASIERLKNRAIILATVRHFFSERNVLEVETPLLARYSVTDPHMDVLTADNPLAEAQRFYLQTSPEYAMKRLLAAGSGAIYQISKAFRRGEQGSRHNPEFTLLEWYRPGFDHFELMDEVAELVVTVLDCNEKFQRLSYREVFQHYLDIDPLLVDCEQLQKIARSHTDIQLESDNRDDWLNVLLAEIIEPKLGVDAPTFIYNYPASQAALAKISTDKNNALVAQRFELYVSGIELANGYFELTNTAEQKKRFQQDQKQRKSLGQTEIESDAYLLSAMESGLPSCAGVALGVDRLVMLAQGARSIADVLAFPVDRI
ncbi:MAG: EF-P lysine aminoacylase EpmA [Pseudomonadales bacterium]